MVERITLYLTNDEREDLTLALVALLGANMRRDMVTLSSGECIAISHALAQLRGAVREHLTKYEPLRKA